MTHTFYKVSLDRRILLWGYTLPLCFDVKKLGTEGTEAQVALVALAVAAGIVYVLAEQLSPRLTPYRSSLRRVTAMWWIYLIASPIPVLVWGVSVEHYLKVLLSFVLAGLSLAVMCAYERRNHDPLVLLRMLVWGALISTVWRVVYALVIADLSFEQMRWQILSAGIPLLIGFGVAGLYTNRYLIISYISLAVAVGSIALSITRSYLIGATFVVAGLLAVEWRRASTVRAVFAASKVGVAGVLALALSILITLYLRDNAIDQWVHRLTKSETDSGLDATLITRLAEYKGQWLALTRNWTTMLIGNGIGASYVWDAALLSLLPFPLYETEAWFAGHSTWVFPFFASGFVLGLAVPLLLFGALVSGFRASVRLRGARTRHGSVICFFALLTYLGLSWTSNLFHERYAGVLLGLLVGALFIYSRQENTVTSARSA